MTIADAGGILARLTRMVEPIRQGKTDLSLVSVDSTTVPAHHDAPG
jgi:hypothetical protein